jgi:PAS domain S-box-containing protein
VEQIILYLFGAASFAPHGYCLLWRPDLIIMHVASDALIAGSYFSIPAALALFMRRRSDLDYHWMVGLFAAFIFACGTTHILEIVSLWYPIYVFQGLVKMVTAGVSLVTALLLWPLIPKILQLPNPSDLTEANAKLQTALQEKELALSQLNTLLDSAPDPTVIVNRDGEIVRSNRQMGRLFGYRASELAGRSVETLLPERYRERHRLHRERFFSTPEARPMGIGRQLYVLSNTGREIPVEISLSPIELHNGHAVCAALRDVSERVEAERQRQTAVRNEILLREIHHRVKNNLQVISSMLNIQSESVQDPVSLDIISESQRRIRSISLIHQKLYTTHRLGLIEFDEYVRDLCSDLMHNFGVYVSGVKLDLDIDNVGLSIDTAVPFGLIINELVTNAFKHAFPDKQSGSIAVKLHDAGGSYKLEVIDDGVGLPAAIDYRKTQTLGLQLVTLLTSQLGGEIEHFQESKGTAFRIVFADVNQMEIAS